MLPILATAVIPKIMDIASGIFSKMFPDPVKQAEMQLELLKLEQAGAFKSMDADLQLALAQIANNTEDSKSTSLLKSGWRPYIGWICGTGLAYQLLMLPFLTTILDLFYVQGWLLAPVVPPSLNIETLLTLLGGMLGFGTMRTYEKFKGVA